jgi:hypothetical protein
VAYALVRAAVTLVSLPALRNENRCRQEWRHGTHECVRHHFRIPKPELIPFANREQRERVSVCGFDSFIGGRTFPTRARRSLAMRRACRSKWIWLSCTIWVNSRGLQQDSTSILPPSSRIDANEVGASFQKRGQTALSTEDALWTFARLWIGDRVVSPRF